MDASPWPARVWLSVTQLQARAPPPVPSATEACSAPGPPIAPLLPLPVRSGGRSRQGRLRDVSVWGRSWGQARVLGGPRGRGGTGGAEWETGRANGGSHLPRAQLWAAGLRRGHSLLQSQSTPSPPQHILFPASQMRELTRETVTFHHPHPALAGAGLGPWRQHC